MLMGVPFYISVSPFLALPAALRARAGGIYEKYCGMSDIRVLCGIRCMLYIICRACQTLYVGIVYHTSAIMRNA